jgi:hypothetical protein
MDKMIVDLIKMFPNLNKEQATKLIESGINATNISKIQGDYMDKITENGILSNSNYSSLGLNMVQQNFNGTSNIMSPYAYINKRVDKFKSIISPHIYYEKFNNSYPF